MNEYLEQYPVLKNGVYLMNASIGGVHQKTQTAIEQSSSQTLNKGAIKDIRFFNLLEETREAASQFLNLSKDEVALSSNSSMNMNLFALMLKEEGFKKVIAPSIEFPSSTLAWFHHGYDVELVEPINGFIDEEELIKKASGQKSLIVCSGVQYLSGQRMNLKRLSEALKSTDSELIINGTQEIGQFQIDLSKLDYFGFTASTHKWLGADLGLSIISIPFEKRKNLKMPIGGWTSVKEPWLLENSTPNFLEDMGAFQIGCLPFNMVAGLKMALEVQVSIGQSLIEKKLLEHSSLLSAAIKGQGYDLIGPRGDFSASGICAFKFNQDLEKALLVFEENKVFVNGRKGSIRASIHFYNSSSDVKKFEEVLRLI
jgi:cysteine desulfurase/selenocysteine lyase